MVYDLKYGFLTPSVGVGECTASNLECDSSLFTDDKRFSPSIGFSKSGMSSMYRLLPDARSIAYINSCSPSILFCNASFVWKPLLLTFFSYSSRALTISLTLLSTLSDTREA